MISHKLVVSDHIVDSSASEAKAIRLSDRPPEGGQRSWQGLADEAARDAYNHRGVSGESAMPGAKARGTERSVSYISEKLRFGWGIGFGERWAVPIGRLTRRVELVQAR
ncbi:MAG: hypothetical protein ACYDBJ_29275, partial [Aggregatilineales bacterium]